MGKAITQRLEKAGFKRDNIKYPPPVYSDDFSITELIGFLGENWIGNFQFNPIKRKWDIVFRDGKMISHPTLRGGMAEYLLR